MIERFVAARIFFGKPVPVELPQRPRSGLLNDRGVRPRIPHIALLIET